MALFKPFSGTSADLNQVSQLNAGYVYLTTDDQKLHADVEVENGVERLTINAGSADFADAANGLVVTNAETGAEIIYTADDFIKKSSGSESDVIPIAQGGTNATTAEEARNNLGVYSKNEINNNISSKSFNVTLTVGGWSDLTYALSLPDLKCGSDGTVNPIIACINNKKDCSNIISAAAEPGVGITFTTRTLPTDNIDLIIIDIR